MDGIRTAVLADISQIEAIYDRILSQEERGEVSVGWIRARIQPTETSPRSSWDKMRS